MSARDDANQPTAEIPFGCRHCGDAQHHHGWQHAPGAGLHHTHARPPPSTRPDRPVTRTERLAATAAAALITAGWLLCRLGHHLTHGEPR